MLALQHEISVADVQEAELRALSLFGDSSNPEYKQMVIFLTYRTIAENPNITVKSIRWILKRYAIDKELVDKALTVLMVKDIFNAIHFWPSTKTKGVKHYKTNPSNELMEIWLDSINTNRPELNQFSVAKPRR